MQISATEVVKLLTTSDAGLRKPGKNDLEFAKLTADSLPKTIEPDSAEVARVAEIVASAPDVREEVVMRLKDMIDKGEYKVSGEEIAEMMIRRMEADKIR